LFAIFKRLRTLCNLGRAIAGLDEDVTALGTESSGDSFRKRLYTLEESGSALDTELELLDRRISTMISYRVDASLGVPCVRSAVAAAKQNEA